MPSDVSDELTPYESGHFPVDHGHRLYYERFGTAGALPVLFVHGGPGAGFSDDDKRFFDPALYDVLLYEQRGTGRSEPFASLAHNDTDFLIEDMERLLDRFGLESPVLFGGSWGSTLSLAFAVRHPDRVSGLVLRGIFLANQDAIRHFVGGGVADFFPEVWQRFVALVPEERRGDISSFYLEKMRSGDKEESERFCYEWARYELSLIKLDWQATAVDDILEQYNYRSLAPLEAHYMANACFLPEDYILEHASALADKPVSIVHGRYDVICPPKQAFALHRALPASVLRFVRAGHSASEEAIRGALIEELGRVRLEMS